MGNLTELTLKLLFLFFPGIIYYVILHKITFRPKKDFNFFLIYSFIFSLMSYAIYAIILKVFKFSDTKIHFLSDIFSKTNQFDYSEIFYVTLVAIITVLIYSFFVNKKVLYNLNKRIENNNWINIQLPTLVKLYKNIAFIKKFDRIDVWSEVLDTPDSNYHWVLITDLELKQKFEGWINKFSDNVKENELFLRDVIVYDLKDNELYRTPAIYLTRKSDNITIDFFRVPKGKHYNRYKTNTEKKNVTRRTTKSKKSSAK